MIHDPMRGQMRALAVGVVILVLITGAMGVLAFFKPAPNFGDSSIMLSKSDGEMFVRIGDRLDPVLNLASARLIVGKADAPKVVDDKFLDTVPRGPLLGIVGAPNGIAGPADSTRSAWAVCDSIRTLAGDQSETTTVQTSVLASGQDFDAGIAPAPPDAAVLARASGQTYLLANGTRAAIDTDNPVLRIALQLDSGEVRDVSPGLLNAFSAVPPINPVDIAGVGLPTGYLPASLPIGSLVRTADSRGQELFVVLADGVQVVSPVTADVIRYGNPIAADVQEVPPALLTAAPRVHDLAVDHYPARTPRFVPATEDPVLCMSWDRPDSGNLADVHTLLGRRLPITDDARPVRLATADDGGPGLEEVYVKPGSGQYVRATGGRPDDQAMGDLFYVNDLGMRFPIADESTANALGLVGRTQPGATTSTPRFAPWAVLSLLPPGPLLSQPAALIAHDQWTADPRGVKVSPPKG